jgi:hypothetical protein
LDEACAVDDVKVNGANANATAKQRATSGSTYFAFSNDAKRDEHNSDIWYDSFRLDK